MKITLKRIDIEDNPSNEVTTHKVFKSRKIFDEEGKPIFHKDGIFSDKIFGQFGRCKCGSLTTPGICKHCGVRVLDKKHIPDFYIKFDNLDIPSFDIDDLGISKKNKDIINNLFQYNGFLYKKEYIEYDLSKLDLTMFDVSKVKIGKEAILSLGVDEEWYNKQITNKLFVPHTSLRKITVQGENYFLGEINNILIDILKKKNKLKTYEKLETSDIFTELSLKKELLTNINNLYDSLYFLLSKRKKSIVNKEVKGQGITGAARAVVTNNFELDEDTALIGYYFIPTLFPHLYEKYLDSDNRIDVVSLNDELKDYMILINRQPTIGEKSIMAFHPVFSDKPDERYVLQLNPIVMDGMAGDFDGDVLLIIALYTKEACKEAKRLLPSRNYIGGADGKIRNGIFEDLEFIMQKSYEDDTAEKVHNLITKWYLIIIKTTKVVNLKERKN